MNKFCVFVYFLLELCSLVNTGFFRSRPSFRYPTTYPKISIDPNLFRSPILTNAAVEHSFFKGDVSSGSMRDGVHPRVVDFKVDGPSVYKDNVADEHLGKKKQNDDDTEGTQTNDTNDALYVALVILSILIVFVYYLYKWIIKPVKEALIPKTESENTESNIDTSEHEEDHDDHDRTSTSL